MRQVVGVNLAGDVGQGGGRNGGLEASRGVKRGLGFRETGRVSAVFVGNTRAVI